MTHPMFDRWIWIRDSNPWPWSVSIHGPDPRCESYKEDIVIVLQKMFPNIQPDAGDIELEFRFIRQLMGRTKPADTTNIQKLTEDALHGVLFEDDIQVRKITSEMLEQSSICSEPAIGIRASRYTPKEIKPAWDGGEGCWWHPHLNPNIHDWQPTDPNKYL